ncbi:DivIVA domain-containing protein [Mechercharimyces sp. CAU 1602]|uniref:DivIVA domain-containing protein n=1 Tax=Mechercharimyces sp. CAU 1602 TaxID=2973933 RepID=UPI002162AC66|nr:DivIVA domain-containing protein [Mechercharimyces sp. CAU 1602]MCS1350514.1 DivIVA domain-containing protein [Mechercharimyces sp. CAU 1602]
MGLNWTFGSIQPILLYLPTEIKDFCFSAHGIHDKIIYDNENGNWLVGEEKMMQFKKLTPMDIFQKDFKTALRGYDVDEVNEFLDLVIKNYEDVTEENKQLKEELRLQKQKPHSSSSDSHVEEALRDVMNRIAQLEQYVYRR